MSGFSRRNQEPFGGDDPASLRMSVVVYLDILGYREVMRGCDSRESGNAQLRQLKAAVKESSHWVKDDFGGSDSLPPRWVTKVFTDNIVIGNPVFDPSNLAEPEIGGLFGSLGFFQMSMIRHGYLVRGAIAVGDLYMDDDVVFGPALLEAYDGEQKLARDPRIVLTPSAAGLVEEHWKWYGGVERAPHNRSLLRAADGQMFVDYLEETVLVAEEEAGPFTETLLEHKERVEGRLETHRSEPRIWSKYEWVARYHNFFCQRYPQYFDEELLISPSSISRSPSRLSDPA